MEQSNVSSRADQPQRTPHPQPETNWHGAATLENIGLAVVALEEDLNDERLLLAANSLAFSPMYQMLVSEHRADLRKLAASDAPDAAEDEEFAHRLFHARLFLAGMRAGRAARKIGGAA